MQFLKLMGVTNFITADEERSIQDIKEDIPEKSEIFNIDNDKGIFCFVSDISNDVTTIAIICNNYDLLDKYIENYLKAIEIELINPTREEITFASFQAYLNGAERREYISSYETVIRKFNLSKLNDRFNGAIDVGENLIDVTDKGTVYEEVGKILANASIIPELDRIYAGTTKKKAYGHPVHYMIETDDRNLRKNMYRPVLDALYQNKRLASKRYFYVDINLSDRAPFMYYDYLFNNCAGGTIIMRFNFDEEEGGNFAHGSMMFIEKIAETIIKYRNRVLTILCFPRECTRLKNAFFEFLGNISFIEFIENGVDRERAKDYLNMMAKNNKIRSDKNLFARLEEDHGYYAKELSVIFDEWYNLKLKTGIYPQYKDIKCVKTKEMKAAPKGSAYSELMEMTGLTEAKKVIKQALNYYKAQKLFAEKVMQADRTSMHMIFTGNPGTAKTSVARLFSEIMKENGVLSVGNLVEVGRADLVGRFVGWTAPTIKKKFAEASGGVLFIDEAYSLVDDRDGMFGDEAINTIVQEMENHRDDVVVIFAGYPDKMERFVAKNPGLRSRIAFHVHFEDYNTEELCQIADLIARKKGLTLTEDAHKKLGVIFETASLRSDFGNGRYVRNIIEKAKMAQADRLINMDYESIKPSDITTICAEDIEMIAAETPNVKAAIGFCA